MHRQMGMPVKTWATIISLTNVSHQVWMNSTRHVCIAWLQPLTPVQKVLCTGTGDGIRKDT